MGKSHLPSRETLPQQALLSAIVDSSFDGIVSKTLDGTITSWNVAAERMFGYSAKEAIGSSIAMLIPEDRQSEEQWILQRLRAGERVSNYETVRLCKDGRRLNVALTSSPVRGPTGTVVGVSKIVRDVSERQSAAIALAESEARLAAIVDSAMDAIVTVDDDGRIVVFNAAASFMLKCAPHDAIGSSLRRFNLEHLCALAKAIDTDQSPCDASGVLHRAVVARRDDGMEFPGEASISCVQHRDARLCTVILRDVSELRQAQADRSALEGHLREAQKMDAIGALAGGIAHDLNNVLGGILGNVALAMGDLAEDHPARMSIDQITIAARRGRAFVRQILAFSRRQAHELVTQPLLPIVTEVAELLRSTLPRTVRLELRTSEQSVFVHADSNQLHQVVLNLCTNAWHSLPQGSGEIIVGIERAVLNANEALTLGLVAPGAYVRVWVQDSGSGMDSMTLSRIFEPFYTTKKRGEGTGLGLSVVHGIVHSHGGGIKVDSQPSAGTTFSVYLPEATAMSPAGARDEPVDMIDGSGVCIAYVDDDEVMRLVVERLLKRLGFEVRCFSAPAHLLREVRNTPEAFDLVISDFSVPGMTGVELAEALEQATPLPVVIISGYVSDEIREAARAAGVHEVIEKEDAIEKLAVVIARALPRQYGCHTGTTCPSTNVRAADNGFRRRLE